MYNEVIQAQTKTTVGCNAEDTKLKLQELNNVEVYKLTQQEDENESLRGLTKQLEMEIVSLKKKYSGFTLCIHSIIYICFCVCIYLSMYLFLTIYNGIELYI